MSIATHFHLLSFTWGVTTDSAFKHLEEIEVIYIKPPGNELDGGVITPESTSIFPGRGFRASYEKFLGGRSWVFIRKAD
ncbi:MAG: hypothetical protein KIH01_07000 [Candidatus Freyarchaeota archaeon]|nr:hypothetical protein [Candidatus Jordarchaeia archaeon]